MTIVGIFENYDSAERAASEIRQQELNYDEISIIRRDADNHEQDGVADGAITGTAVGGVAGLVLGMSSVVVPGFGILAAAGPVAGLLAGALTGGIAGSLIDMGISDEASARYENDIRQGMALFSMPITEENGGSVSSILKRYGARSVELHK